MSYLKKNYYQKKVNTSFLLKTSGNIGTFTSRAPKPKVWNLKSPVCNRLFSIGSDIEFSIINNRY